MYCMNEPYNIEFLYLVFNLYAPQKHFYLSLREI